MKYLFTLTFCHIILLSSCNKMKEEVSSPNIVIIYADDMGYGDPGLYNPDSKIPTPNIDNLAKTGMMFTDAHSPSSVCTPSRYGLLTGRYAWRTELKRSVLWSWDKPLIEKDRLTLPKMFKTKGYETACIGKWHLGWRWPGQDGKFVNDTMRISGYSNPRRNQLPEYIDFSKKLGGGPIEAGFDYYFGDDVPNFPPYTWFENQRLLDIPDTIKPPEMYGNPGVMVKGWDLTAVMPEITRRASNYIKESSEKPFFLYFPLTAPHTPIAPKEQFLGKSEAGLYGDFVHEVDWTVGEIVKALKESGKWENTILVFTSDNGSPGRNGKNMGGPSSSVHEYGHYPSGKWRGIKADIFEGGHRVPFLINWPENIRPGQINENLTSQLDLFATFAEIVNYPLSENDAVDSRSMRATLKDTGVETRKTLVNHSINGSFAYRKGAWKLIDARGSGGWTRVKLDENSPERQLYNLADDPGELNNLYPEETEIAEELLTELNDIRDNENN